MIVKRVRSLKVVIGDTPFTMCRLYTRGRVVRTTEIIQFSLGGGGYFIVGKRGRRRRREDDERLRMAAVAVFAPRRTRLKATFT